MRLNYQIFTLLSETSELRGMKNVAIQNRVLQRDRVLQRRVLERYYCIGKSVFWNPCFTIDCRDIYFDDYVTKLNFNDFLNIFIVRTHYLFIIYFTIAV